MAIFEDKASRAHGQPSYPGELDSVPEIPPFSASDDEQDADEDDADDPDSKRRYSTQKTQNFMFACLVCTDFC